MLAVDTSSAVVSTALVDISSGEVRPLATRDLDVGNRHGELLAASIAEVLHESHLTPSALTAIAAGLGPGPFTGLRVGVVTAATLSDALGVPAYGACSLDAIAATETPGHEFLVCTDARRKQVYWARYDATGVRVEGPDIATAAWLAEQFAQHVPLVVGAAVPLYANDFAAFDRSVERAVSAVDVAALLADRARLGASADVMEPLYLRRPDATPPGRRKSVLPA